MKSLPNPAGRILAEDELTRLFAALRMGQDGLRNEACARLIYDLALRAGEASAYRIADVWNDYEVPERIIVGPLQRGRHERHDWTYRAITPETRYVLTEWILALRQKLGPGFSPNTPLWYSRKHGALDRASLYRAIPHAARLANLKGKVNVESLRRTRALLQANAHRCPTCGRVDLSDITEVTRQKSIEHANNLLRLG